MKKIISTLALSLSLLPLAPGVYAQAAGNGPDGTAGVIGGTGITTGADFFCSLLDPSDPGLNWLMCGASLIHHRWVLTAAHCLHDQMTQQPVTAMDVAIAPYIPGSGTNYKRLKSEKIFIHESYDPTTQPFDIALIKLKSAVTNPTIIALPAAGDNSLTPAGGTCHIAGFGLYDPMQPNQPDTLQYAQIVVIDNNTCNQPAMYAGEIQSSQMCAGFISGMPKGGASGDSGGPLWVVSGGKKIQVGLVSYGKGMVTTQDGPGVFTRLSHYRTWIDSVINNNSVSVDDVEEEARVNITRTDKDITVNLDQATAGNLHYTIYSYDGRAVQTGVWAKGKFSYTADARNLQNTLHFIQITDGMGYTYAGKIPVLR